ncbi:MAG TPA: PxKF domain-containing protein [Herpetosiphonaceae bacterium]
MNSQPMMIKRFNTLRLFTVLGMVLGLFAPLTPTTSVSAASVSSASFTGGTSTINVSGTLYAKNGGALTLTVVTDSTTKCVEVVGAHTATQSSNTVKSSWTFSFTAGSGDGVRTVTTTAYRSFNGQGKCTANAGESVGAYPASYILDNTGPVVTAALTPAANAAGWNNSNVSIAWTASDAGSGVASGPIPATDSQQQNTPGVPKSAIATDRLGNTGSASVTVKLDKTAPSINASRTPDPNSFGWNNSSVTIEFTCADALSGIKSCTGGGSVTLSSEGANQSVPGTAIDNADNTNNTGVSGINIDTTDPTLSGAPTTAPNAAGWYKNDVTIDWTAADTLSGIVAEPANSTIGGEGTDLIARETVSDRAGNTTSATSPAVKIDRTAPNTSATAPTSWNNTNVTVSLNAADNSSGVKATYFKLNGGAQQTGTSVAISAEGIHSLQFWSEDQAGNVEAAKSVQVKIDRTPPTINHTQSPAANILGWNNSNVTVTFTCADSGGSGVASCTAPQTVTTEGQSQAVTGTATDHAGNTATDPATVSIDKTRPTATAAADRSANSLGWYNDNVTVTFTCADALSGLYSCSASQTLGEGANQSATGAASDAAGNVSEAAVVSGINVDKTAPTLSGAATTAPNANGWYNGDVTVHWTAADSLSGLASAAPDASTIVGEGDDLSSSTSVSDKAGNSASTTVKGIKIDRTAPSTLASVPAPLDSGWYAAGFNVTLNGIDTMSGVDKTYYSVNGGAAHVYSGSFNHNTPGVSTITFWSVDQAGNVEDKAAPGHSITLKIDNLPPAIQGIRSPAANGFGWNNVPVTVSFTCADGESGLASGVAGCTDAVTLSNEGASQSVVGNALDNAGNSSSAKVEDINIDTTVPTLSGAPTTNANAAGWYKGDVTIAWTAQDGLAGIDPATQPADSVITGQGSSLSAGPVSIADKAGNSTSATVGGIKIDRTAPTISGATVNDNGTARSANAAGWFNSAVRVRFTCADTLSGVQECASDVLLTDDGVSQRASGTATDKADNSASATVSGIKIDSQAPQTSANNQCDSKNGWCKGQTATVVLTAADQSGLSGVKEIRYSVNGGPVQSATGSTANVNVPLAARSGLATVKFYAVDNAGNSELESGVSLKFDNIAPTMSHTLNPTANAAGWNKADVTVHFDATDDDGGSGVDPSTVTPDQSVSTETAGQTINGEAYDLAGNKGTDAVTVRLDKTAPTISGAATTAPNANGWYNSSVTVKFTCADALSGVATCPADQMLTANAANQSITGKAIDKADNAQDVAVTGINIDSVAPTITINGLKAIYTLGEAAALSCTATDSGSGLDSPCAISVSGGTANGVGTFNYTATATDKAGNLKTESGTYKVIYKWGGFQQPINDTAHQIGTSTSIFKGGSTVPVKLQLKKADGSIVQSNTLPQWLTPAKGSPTTAQVDESVYSDPATGGSTYKYDATAQQYIYNWSTKGAAVGYYHRIGVTLDDGQTYYVNIGLR